MAFEGIASKLQSVFKKLTGKGRLSEREVRDAMREIKLALLESDVNFRVVKDFIKAVEARAVGAEVLESLTPGQMIIKIVNEELTALMGSTNSKLEFGSRKPSVILMAGLQGAGKTTMCGKLATLIKKQYGKTVLLCACDIYRPAAIEQLKVVGGKADTPVFERGTQAPEKTVKEAIDFAKSRFMDVVIVDTAGRLHIDNDMMSELQRVRDACDPSEILLVIDVTGKPIKFVGIGEKMTDLEPFHPDRMASRILGMGDVLTLIEKAEKAFDEKKARELEQKMRSNAFTLEDFLDQMEQRGGAL